MADIEQMTMPDVLGERQVRESYHRVRGCVSNLLAVQPFFGNLSLRMAVQADNRVKTIAGDGTNIFFNPKWVAECTADQIKAAICHIVLACALKHHTRRNERTYGRWQRASRMVTGPFLKSAGLTDDDYPLPLNYQGGSLDVSVEQAYDMLEDDDDEGDDPNGTGAGAGARGSGPGSGQGQGKGTRAEGQGQGGPGQGQGQGQGPGQGQGNSDPNGKGEVMDAPVPEDSTHEEAMKQSEQEWDSAMQSAHQHAKAEGRKPGMLSDLIDGAHQSHIGWRELLRRFLLANAKDDYTWSRPNRRHIDSGTYLPSLHSEAMPAIVFAIDTSGSVSNPELNAMWNEIREVVAETRPQHVTVIQCDARIAAIDHYDTNDLPDELTVKGRGGTRFIPVFEAVEDINEKPACLIYCTDMCCSEYPDIPPDYPVLWASTSGGGYWDDNVPFGEVIQVEVDNSPRRQRR